MSKFAIDWTNPALADLGEAGEYIAADHEPAADRMIDRIQAAAESLAEFPKLGRAGKLRGSREFIVSGTPYILVYELAIGVIQIRRVIHGARDWPPSKKKRA